MLMTKQMISKSPWLDSSCFLGDLLRAGVQRLNVLAEAKLDMRTSTRAELDDRLTSSRVTLGLMKLLNVRGQARAAKSKLLSAGIDGLAKNKRETNLL